MHAIEKYNSPETGEAGEIPVQDFEPVFVPQKELIALATSGVAGKVGDFMARQIARKPADLQLHLQRIRFFARQKNSSGLYAALLDLFLVLEDKGAPLRQRLLIQYRAHLEPPQAAVLAARLKGRDWPASVPPARASVLSAGCTGRKRIIDKKQNESSAASRDVVEDARDLIDSGQVGAATVLLKKALMVNPRRKEVSEELMLIYRHSRNAEAVSKLLQAMKNMPLALREEWHALSVWLNDRRQTSREESHAC